MSLPSRLANLSYAQLLEFAVDACESSPELKNKADALIAEVAPLPSWCVDVLLSPDLLPQLFSSLGLSEHAAAGVCTTWSRAYSRQLRRCCYVDPRSVRQLAGVPILPNGLCMLPGGVLAITSCGYSCGIHHRGVHFVAARNGSDPQALAACRASSLAARRFRWLLGLALTNDGLLACNLHEPSAMLYKFALVGSMDELAAVPALGDDGDYGQVNYGQGFKRCAVHQQTQRTYAIVGEEGHHALILLDANLQVVAIVEEADAPEEVGGLEYSEDDNGPICDIAVHGDQVIVLTSDRHEKGSGLRLLDLDGRYLRTIAAALFENPHAFTVSHGRAFVVDDDNDNAITDWEAGKVLYVIDILSGDILQSVRFELKQEVLAMLVDGDEIYIAGFNASQVIVLQYAGSEV